MERSRQRREYQRAEGSSWPRRPAWCWPTSAASRSRATPPCAASSAANGCHYQVVKNTLARASPSRGRRWRGSRSSSSARPRSPTRSRTRRRRPRWPPRSPRHEEKFVIKGGYVDGKALDVKGVEALSNLPGQGRAACDFPCNFARRASELPPAHHGRPAELRLLLAARERALRRERKAAQANRPAYDRYWSLQL